MGSQMVGRFDCSTPTDATSGEKRNIRDLQLLRQLCQYVLAKLAIMRGLPICIKTRHGLIRHYREGNGIYRRLKHTAYLSDKSYYPGYGFHNSIAQTPRMVCTDVARFRYTKKHPRIVPVHGGLTNICLSKASPAGSQNFTKAQG